MALVIQMPKLSDTMEEGGIAEWFKKEGDFVEEGEILLSIETDKATMEYASPEEGTLLKIIAKVGKNVPLNKPIAVLGEKGEKFDLSQLTSAEQPSLKEEKKTTSQEVEATFAASDEKTPIKADTKRVKASPLAKKIAKEKNIDLTSLSGSGPQGRIVLKDVENIDSPGKTPSLQHNQQRGEDRIIPVTMMRKTIAKRLVAGKNEAPHFYLSISANMETLFSWRKTLNSSDLVKSGAQGKVSVNDLIILACAKAIRLHPEINSSWNVDHIIMHGNVDICMAVALPSGLITPVIKNANLLGLREISVKARELATKAKDGKLAPDEYTGGTFTVSNLGMTRVESFTAIINPPQACILAVGTSRMIAHVSPTGEIVPQNRMEMTLSCDHRLVDGMLGAKFLETLVSFLENPLLMLG